MEDTSAVTDHIHRAYGDYPLFAAAMKNPEFARLFVDSLEEIGSVNFDIERVNTELRKYLDIWSPLMPDSYRRYGETSSNWEMAEEAMIRFFETRFSIIMGFAENL